MVRAVTASPSPRRLAPAAVCIALFALVVVTGESWSVLADPWHVVDDARQHVFWTYRYQDPALFPGDLYADFFSALAPVGYHALYWLFAKLGDPLTIGRWLPFALAAVALTFAWRLGRALEPRWGGFLAAFLLLPFLYLVRGGLPRSFALALLLPHLFYVATARLGRATIVLALQALVYPQTFLLGLGIQGLPALRQAGRGGARRPLVMLLLGIAIGGLVLAPRYLIARPAALGTLVKRAEASQSPEFQRGGRAAFFDPSPVRFYLTGRRSGLGWNDNMTELAILVVLLALVRRRAVRSTPTVVLDTTIVSLGLFVAAHVLLFRLHLPNRYVQWTLPLAAIMFNAAHARPAAEWLRDRVPLAVGAWTWLARVRWGIAAIVLLALVAGAVSSARRSDVTEGDVIAVHRYLRALPRDALVAGRSTVLAEVPLLDHRRILDDPQFALPYFSGYYHEVVRRTTAREAVWQAGSPEALGRFCRDFGVSHVLVDRRDPIRASLLAVLSTSAGFHQGRFLVAPCPW
jgi:hypothetical protein